jgi:cob(I)alamin adenosyltransferase
VVYISKVYTKSGDGGRTMLASGDTVSKADGRVAAYGDVDELNAVVGLCRLELRRDPNAERDLTFVAAADAELGRIQQELFNLGAELSTPGASDEADKARIHDRHVEALEHAIDRHNDALEPLESFILPGGGPGGVAAHLARTVCRRAERTTVELSASASIRPQVVRYLNRLSDYFFVLGRAAAKRLGYPELLWTPQDT